MDAKQVLFVLYTQYYEEFNKIQFSKPKNAISEPFFVGIPDDWFSSKNRIMVVGEEGRSSWNYEDDIISRMTKWNLVFCNEQIADSSYPNTAFWKTVKQIKALKPSTSIIWNTSTKLVT